MNKTQGKISFRIIVISLTATVFFLFVLIAYLGYRIYSEQHETLSRTQESVFTLSRFVSQLEKELYRNMASTTEVSDSVVKKGEYTEGELRTLRDEIEKQDERAPDKLSSELISNIMKRVVFVYCKGPKGEWRGSGTTQLMWDAGPIVITNYHVIGAGDPVNIRCEIHLPLPPEYSTYGKAFLADLIRYDENYPIVDIAVLQIRDVSDNEREEYFSSFPIEFCRSEDINAGNDVTVFGYPKFGGNTLTLTTGVISGFLKTEWGLKYKTSAKMDLGNSGGIAVDNKSLCIIGIPTWTQYGGKIGDLIETGESLGQIQSWEMIVTSGGISKQ
ncbi:MAG: hypothetical protein A2934_01700 [Candidatus Sungbacteria bacterium RIFCSPLOWO2_01_FULL_47_10]|uniref:Serine protease n=1 Tax=Candidatus Sungbacteria bacterium RIFCSPLOWO2_01_FULL_47_10 TaxID=1802276 RepID=A0A1G2L1F8_9BACT|nr:MAG: hypothetical protein A2934_01700 [Candidatus Sungbacteria bacterium RIFCSPLOWO2_01_FULL_47_10]